MTEPDVESMALGAGRAHSGADIGFYSGQLWSGQPDTPIPLHLPPSSCCQARLLPGQLCFIVLSPSLLLRLTSSLGHPHVFLFSSSHFKQTPPAPAAQQSSPPLGPQTRHAVGLSTWEELKVSWERSVQRSGRKASEEDPGPVNGFSSCYSHPKQTAPVK